MPAHRHHWYFFQACLNHVVHRTTDSYSAWTDTQRTSHDETESQPTENQRDSVYSTVHRTTVLHFGTEDLRNQDFWLGTLVCVWFEGSCTERCSMNIRYIQWTASNELHPSWWQSKLECRAVMSENDQKIHGGLATRCCLGELPRLLEDGEGWGWRAGTWKPATGWETGNL